MGGGAEQIEPFYLENIAVQTGHTQGSVYFDHSGLGLGHLGLGVCLEISDDGYLLVFQRQPDIERAVERGVAFAISLGR